MYFKFSCLFRSALQNSMCTIDHDHELQVDMKVQHDNDGWTVLDMKTQDKTLVVLPLPGLPAVTAISSARQEWLSSLSIGMLSLAVVMILLVVVSSRENKVCYLTLN